MHKNIINRFENIEKIIEYMPGNIYWFDKNCLGIGCNNNVLALFNFKSVNEFTGLTFEKMGELAKWSPEATASFKKDTLEVISTGQAKINIEEPPIPGSHSDSVYYLTHRVPFYDNQGEIAGMVGVSIDITERKKTEAALKKAKEEAEIAKQVQSDFIANMSHDIKTPLAGIIGMADVLASRLTDENDIGFIRDIIVAGQQLMIFFDNCLEVAKSEARSSLPLTESFNLKTLIQEIGNLFQAAMTNKGLKFIVYFDDQLQGNMLGSRSGLFRVLMNLVGNAIKFTETGSITIDAKLGATSTSNKTIVLITVKDTGIGIPKDKHAHIFERFTRLTQSNKGLSAGSGLGLYLVKKYVDAMQAEIHLSSVENQGSQFVIAVPLEISSLPPTEHEMEKTFPLVNQINIRKNIAAKTTLANPMSITARILLIEDNFIAQTVARSILTSLHCQVDIASTGKEAMDLFEAGKYQLVFTDLGLPDIDGYGLVRYFRKIEEGSSYQTPIIILTAHITKEIRKECTDIGINEVLHKPLMSEKAKILLERYATTARSMAQTKEKVN